MDIVYLESFARYKEKGAGKRIAAFGAPQGLSQPEIKQMELELNGGNPFPKTYKEFLGIGGAYSGIAIDHNGKHAPGIVLKYRQALQKRGISISRPIAVIDTREGQCGIFIYLDEEENPQPWLFSLHEAYDSDDGEIIWPSPFKTFKDMIEELVYCAENDLPV